MLSRFFFTTLIVDFLNTLRYIGQDYKVMNDDLFIDKQNHMKAKSIENQYDLQKADSAYKPIESFEKWKNLKLDLVRWERYAALIGQRKNADAATLKKAQEIVKRAAAVETGAIEGLYEVDRGFTFTVATEAAMWQAAVHSKGSSAVSLIESQLYAYEFVLDFATQNVPIAEAWIRQLHEEICKGQNGYIVHTSVGNQNQQLPLGEYKKHSNHVKTLDGGIHSYAPVELTPSEMQRYCLEIQSKEFLSAHPVLQAAYSHYCLTAIHPFADGNGRVARALASVFTYRAQSVPLLILAEHKKDYFDSLFKADQNAYQFFVDFILERTLDAMQLVDESIRAAKSPQMSQSLETLRNLFTTKGGYTHTEVDSAAGNLLNLLNGEFNQIGAIYNVANQFQMRTSNNFNRDDKLLSDLYRYPLSNISSQLVVTYNAFAPAQAEISMLFFLHVPIDCGLHDDIILHDAQTSEIFNARINELLPNPTPSVKMRAKIWVESIVGEAITQLSKLAEENLKNRGYRK